MILDSFDMSDGLLRNNLIEFIPNEKSDNNWISMAQQWEPQQTLEPPLALELIREQFPELSPVEIQFLGAGWDNTAFVINKDLIFRFPRREIAVPLLETEWCILRKLATRLPFPIPIPKWRGSPTSHFPYPFIGYRMLPGYTACHANLTEEERGALAEPIARFLSLLHTTPKSAIAGCKVPEDNHDRIDGNKLTDKVKKNMEELSQLKFLENPSILESLVARLQGLRSPTTSAVVHGDFYVRHLLVDERHQFCGVIDWGDVHFGDPAIDLSIAHSFLPLSAHAKFRETYGEISADTWSLALLRAIYSSTLLVLYGYHINDRAILREGLRSLRIMV